jgi:hypothetical protein
MGAFSIWHWIIALLVWFVLPAIISVPMARKRNREAFVWVVLAFSSVGFLFWFWPSLGVCTQGPTRDLENTR